jgi:hypothetical protein
MNVALQYGLNIKEYYYVNIRLLRIVLCRYRKEIFG